MKRNFSEIFVVFLASLFVSAFSMAQGVPPMALGVPDAPGEAPGALPGDPPGDPPGGIEVKADIPMIRKLSDGKFQIDNIVVSKPEGSVSAPGVVNMDEGLIEYLACGPAGKLHESVLRVDVKPYYLQIALLLLGLEPGDKPLEYQGADEVPEGDPVEILVSWENVDGKKVECRAEELVWNVSTKKPMKRTNWVFAGSKIMDGRFMAQIEQSIAATFHDPFSIIDHPLPTGADDTVYVVNMDRVPPRDTPVVFTVKIPGDSAEDTD